MALAEHIASGSALRELLSSFFSSRRRHTIFDCDWSSDVCSSDLIATKSPNAAHYALVELERRVERFWLITQNVDGLHPVAGSQKLSEIHGNIWKVRCTQCGQVGTNRTVPIPILPRCPRCDGLLRPHIVWFGESLDPVDLERSSSA